MKALRWIEKKTMDVALCLLLCITFILSASSPSFAFTQKNGWIYQSSYPTSGILLGVKFVTPQKGWIIGTGGTILYTGDDGNSWEAQESGTNEMLKGIFFVDDKTGWVVGDNGVILHTGDGGKSWERQGDTTLTLHKVFFLNTMEGWAVGERGIILHTVDGGKSWEKQLLGSGHHIAGVFFINSKTGWLLSAGKVYKTNNGGKDWESVLLQITTLKPLEPGEDVYNDWRGDIFFNNDKEGWAVIGIGEIFHTDDGGKSWNQQFSIMYNEFMTLNFADKMSGCTAGDAMFCTDNGGKTWEKRQEVMPSTIFMGEYGGERTGITRIDFVDKNVGWAVGAYGLIAKTEDGGKSWATRNRGFSYSTYFANEKTGWTVKSDRKLKKREILKTDDGGDTWRVQKEFKEQTIGINIEGGQEIKKKFDVVTGFHNSYFIDANRGWFVGYQGYIRPGSGMKELNSFILHTSDGGKTWVTQFKKTGRNVWDIGWEIGELRDVFFANPEFGWVVGGEGLILHTKDGGSHWKRQKAGPTFNFKKVHFIDEKRGWIIGDKRLSYKLGQFEETSWSVGIMLYTIDGGQHWQASWTKRDVELTGIFFVDRNMGWITGMNIRENDDEPGYGLTPDLFLQTTDGGKTWQDIGLKGLSFGAPFFIDNKRGWIETGERDLLITEDGGKTWNEKKTGLHKYPWRPFEALSDTK